MIFIPCFNNVDFKKASKYPKPGKSPYILIKRYSINKLLLELQDIQNKINAPKKRLRLEHFWNTTDVYFTWTDITDRDIYKV